jgi:TPR repeat protein
MNVSVLKVCRVNSISVLCLILITSLNLSGCDKNRETAENTKNQFSSLNLDNTKSITDTINNTFLKVDSGEIPLEQAYDAFKLFVQMGVNDKTVLIPLLKGAADRGHAEAQRALGISYIKGIYTPKDIAEGKEWLTLSALKGDEKSQFSLGELYFNSKYGAPDWSKAARWFEASSEQGNASAQFYTAVIYDAGEHGLKRNKNKAYEYALLSASQKLVYAESLLGQWFYNGRNVNKDLTQSFKYYSRAADQGDAKAMAWVATLHLGAPYKDLPRAYAWYALAAENGHEEAKLILGDAKKSWGVRLISNQLKPEVRREGEIILNKIRSQVVKSGAS